jgi:hypothetical protein
MRQRARPRARCLAAGAVRSLCPNCPLSAAASLARLAACLTRQVVPAFGALPLRADASGLAPPLVGGSRQSLAVAADGRLFTWGWNQKSSLGLGHQAGTKQPCAVSALAGVRVAQAREPHARLCFLRSCRSADAAALRAPPRRRAGAAGTAWL